MALMWRPGKASRGTLVLVAGLSVLGYLLVQGLPEKRRKSYYTEKLDASRIMARGMEAIRRARVDIYARIDREHDPLGTGMIGSGLTPITSKEGVLAAKQTTANPNWAAVMVHLFKRAKLKEGDVVAMAFSGSFPSLNLASLAAAEALGLHPVIITSNSASRWGATDPQLTWLDMERLLFEKGITHHRSVAATMGGEQDRGGGLPPDGVQTLREVIRRNGVELLDPPDLPTSFDMRMNIYREEAANRPIACYVNIGGGAGSVGSTLVKKLFSPGLNRTTPQPGRLRDSVMTRMSREGVPVINMVYIATLAPRYGLPVTPTQVPQVGEGGIYAAAGYNMLLVWLTLGGLVIVIFVLLRTDLRHYALRFSNLLRKESEAAGQDAPPAAKNGSSSQPPP
ncbi:MAG: poly-gamma-glutamate system protein [Deltaproteobacteria bacterium]|nr:poly-gamma-glutamate system protein [Deltaproteobacteria bacterium]